MVRAARNIIGVKPEPLDDETIELTNSNQLSTRDVV